MFCCCCCYFKLRLWVQLFLFLFFCLQLFSFNTFWPYSTIPPTPARPFTLYHFPPSPPSCSPFSQKNKTQQQSSQTTINSVSCCWTTPRQEAGSGVWWIYFVTVLWKNKTNFAVSQLVSNVNSLLVRRGTLYPLPLLNAGVLSGLNLCRSSLYCAKLFNRKCFP